MDHGAESVIGVGIAGLGRAGWGLHARILEALPEKYRVVAACDPLESRRDEAQARFDCPTYSDVADFLGDASVELVVVAMPSHLHADLSIEALRRGKHVLVEKPFATNLEDVDRMIAAATQAGKVLSGSQNRRYESDFLKVREVIETGKLGRIVQLRVAWHRFQRRWDWQTLTEFGGGSLANEGPHVIDQALALFHASEPEVFCHMDHTPLSLGDAEDHVKVILRAPGEPLIDLEFTNACAYPQEQWLVMGTQGSLTGSHGKYRWRYIEPALLPERELSRDATPDRSYNREELAWIEESSDLSAEPFGMSHRRLYLDLYLTLREGKPLAITPESIRRQLSVMDKCRQVAPCFNEQSN
ncbi:MAG: Gfo/Idh/MocA family oxidoreductase [Chloroflexota bacterium]|nr:Gfo/Idh/MocA family oxidoreductase [Chloroflexota bacterium]